MPTHLGNTHNTPLTDLHTYHQNPRRGDVNTIANSLRNWQHLDHDTAWD